MELTGRTVSFGEGDSNENGLYRFGFNGKENDREYGVGLVQDYGFRIYHPGIGKFLSVDPLTRSYPWYTPYQFASNTPISSIDIDGLESDKDKEFRPDGIPKKINISDLLFAPFSDYFNSERELENVDKPEDVKRAFEKHDAALKQVNNITVVVETTNTAIGLLLPFASAAELAAMTAGETTLSQVVIQGSLVVLDIFTIGKGSAVGKADEAVELFSLYRAVSKSEMKDILTSKQLRLKEGGLEAKQFTEDIGDAFKEGLEQGEEFFLLKIDIPEELANKLHKSKDIDAHITKGQRNIFTADPEQLEKINKSSAKIEIIGLKSKEKID